MYRWRCPSIRAPAATGFLRSRCLSRPTGTRRRLSIGCCPAARATPWWPPAPAQAKQSAFCCHCSSTAASNRPRASKEALQKTPPDILLTNYKQLDYLLIQPHVQSLWEHNGRLADGTSTLRYLVVDEFHSFDGAQGTDLAGQIFASSFEPGSLPLRGRAS